MQRQYARKARSRARQRNGREIARAQITLMIKNVIKKSIAAPKSFISARQPQIAAE